MTTTVIHSDVSGSMYSGVEFDYRKLKAIRKFIVFSTLTDFNDIINDGTEGLKVNTTTGAAASCPLGDRWIDPDSPHATNNTNAIVHPDDNELPLQTVDVASLGEQRFLVTANFFTTPITWGSGGTVATSMSLRTEIAAIRLFSYWNGTERVTRIPSSCTPPNSPLQYSLVTTVVQLKILIPFFLYKNPVDSNGAVLGYLGGLNAHTVTLGGINFSPEVVRFDGISMDEFGSVVSSGSATYRFRGNFEFTARSDGFTEETVVPLTNSWDLVYDQPTVNLDGAWTNPYTDLGVPQ